MWTETDPLKAGCLDWVEEPIKADNFDFYHSFEKESKLKYFGVVGGALAAFVALFAVVAWITHAAACG
jgi:hypothetical protein